MRKSNFTITHNIVSIVFMSSHTQQDLRPYLCYSQQIIIHWKPHRPEITQLQSFPCM